jgi:hypothetical protein
MFSSTSLTINLPKHLFATFDDRAGNSAEIDRQIHLKSLALYAADWYLQCLQFKTRHDDRADWWIPYLAQSAPLEIVKVGNLECIPVVNDTMMLTISPDLKDDRIGYLFVRIDDSLTSAEIIGFRSKYEYMVNLNRLQSTDDLIDYLCDLESQSQLKPVIKMADWFAGIGEDIWRKVNTLPLTPAYRSRQQQEVSLSVKSVERGKEIKLGDADDSPIVVLTIRSEQMDDVNSDITLQLSPKFPASTLPIDLKFIVRDDRGEEISSFESKAGDCYGEIVLDNGKEGEQFSLEIEFDRVKKIGTFEVGYRNHAES